MPLAENGWTRLLALFSTQMRLEDGLNGCLNSLWLGLLGVLDWALFLVIDGAIN